MPASDVQVLREPAHRFLHDRRPLAIAVLHLNPGVSQDSHQTNFFDQHFERKYGDWTVPDVILRPFQNPGHRRMIVAGSEKGLDLDRQSGALDETHSDVEAGAIMQMQSDDGQLKASNAGMESLPGYSCIVRSKGLAKLHGVAAAMSMQFG